MNPIPRSGASQPRSVRHGSSPHLVIETIEDVRQVLKLDTAHWVASAAPLHTINADPDFLAMLDDGDGRVRAEEVRQALAWLLSSLDDHRGLIASSDTLKLGALSSSAEPLRQTAERVLERAGLAGAERVSLESVRALRVAEQQRGLSAAGLVTPSAEAPPQILALIDAILASGHGVAHPHHSEAIDRDAVQRFFEQLTDHLAWREEAQTNPALCPFGDHTEAVAELAAELEPKYTQYFLLCDAVRLDERLSARAWLEPERLRRVDLLDAEALDELLKRAPLAPPRADGLLPHGAPLNPAWVDALEQLGAQLPEGRPVDRASWRALTRALAPWRAWQRRAPPGKLGEIERSRQRELLEDQASREALIELIARSHDEAVVLDRVRELERLISLQAHMLSFLNSFVSFPDLYDPTRRALFEMGTLVIDGRRLRLAMRVTDRARHARFSDASNMFVLYVEILACAGTVLYEVAVPVTHGGQGSLIESKWAVFYDTQGREHHAKVVQIVDNPISLREAILAPFKRLARSINERVEAFSEERQRELVERGVAATERADGTLLGALGSAVASPPQRAAGQAKPKQARASSGLSNVLAGGAVALAALGSSAAFITSTAQRLDARVVALGLLGFVAALLAPLTLVAWLKLRRRDLSALLEGSGWAINAPMRLTRAQARTFTHTPRFPARSPRKAWLKRALGLALLVALLALLAALMSTKGCDRIEPRAPELLFKAPSPQRSERLEALSRQGSVGLACSSAMNRKNSSMK